MERVGRYTIVGRLGRGGMSTIYKARAPVTGRIVAVKILRPRDEIFADLVGEERLRAMFIEEARIMGAINHEHVAAVLDCGEHDGNPFIVLEYYSHSIGELIGEAYRVEDPSRRLTVQRSALYVLQTLMGLERLHFAGIVHRDIKPYNLMLTSDDRVKIIDFGLSRVRGEEVMAIPGMQVGSPYYAAPEQIKRPDASDGRADIYSIGVLLYRLLTGVLIQEAGALPAPPSQLNPELDERWDDLLYRALEPDPARRFDATAMRVALDILRKEWQGNLAAACPLNGELSSEGEVVSVRSQPQRIMYKDCRELLDLDELFRPRNYLAHQLKVCSPLLLYDPCTSLYWQRLGSGYTLSWQEAADYVAHLNSIGFGGRSGWRLPTAAELVTVLRAPSAQRDFCVDPHFDTGLHWLWSADHATKKAAWMADIVESYIGRLDMDGAASVCAVSAGTIDQVERKWV